MTSRKILLMSPREPSGATWLINCLLELGIRNYRHESKDMWSTDGRRYQLTPKEDILKKWLPALWDHEDFDFRDDIEVEWAHYWPKAEHDANQVIVFTRDPRDSIYSRYKRESPQQDFDTFLSFPDVNTMLDKAHTWRLFNLAWMEHPRNKVFRFEDYKRDAAGLLKQILIYLDLHYSEADIQRAISASTFERATDAERKYRSRNPDDDQLINRAGRAGEWQSGGISEKALRHIETVCGDVMARQGYLDAASAIIVDYTKLRTALPFWRQVKAPSLASVPQDDSGVLKAAVALARDDGLYRSLQNANLPSYELALLLDNLESLLQSLDASYDVDFRGLRRSFGLSAGIFERGKIFLKSRVKLLCNTWLFRVDV